jgi:hypothetical protein
MRLIALLVCLLAALPVRADTTIYYLHGKFVEENGPEGVHPHHGPYRYRDILTALARDGAVVESEMRARDTDVSRYADKIVAEIRARLAEGQSAKDIAVVGASKGGIIGALVSARLAEDDVTFVLMGACNGWLEETYEPRFRGRLLAVYDASDDIAGSCADSASRSKRLAEFREIRLDTGRGHGFLYTPGEEWIAPALDWIGRRNIDVR